MPGKTARLGLCAALVVAAALSSFNVGCAHVVGRQYRVSEELVEREGTRYFDSGYADVYYAVREGVQRLGFSVAQEFPGSGQLVTNQVMPYSDMRGTNAAREYVSLTIDVGLNDAGLVGVRVIPRRFTGAEKAETYQYWRSEAWLENYWQDFFADIAAEVKSPAIRPDELGQSRTLAVKQETPASGSSRAAEPPAAATTRVLP